MDRLVVSILTVIGIGPQQPGLPGIGIFVYPPCGQLPPGCNGSHPVLPPWSPPCHPPYPTPHPGHNGLTTLEPTTITTLASTTTDTTPCNTSPDTTTPTTTTSSGPIETTSEPNNNDTTESWNTTTLTTSTESNVNETTTNATSPWDSTTRDSSSEVGDNSTTTESWNTTTLTTSTEPNVNETTTNATSPWDSTTRDSSSEVGDNSTTTESWNTTTLTTSTEPNVNETTTNATSPWDSTTRDSSSEVGDNSTTTESWNTTTLTTSTEPNVNETTTNATSPWDSTTRDSSSEVGDNSTTTESWNTTTLTTSTEPNVNETTTNATSPWDPDTSTSPNEDTTTNEDVSTDPDTSTPSNETPSTEPGDDDTTTTEDASTDPDTSTPSKETPSSEPGDDDTTTTEDASTDPDTSTPSNETPSTQPGDDDTTTTEDPSTDPDTSTPSKETPSSEPGDDDTTTTEDASTDPDTSTPSNETPSTQPGDDDTTTTEDPSTDPDTSTPSKETPSLEPGDDDTTTTQWPSTEISSTTTPEDEGSAASLPFDNPHFFANRNGIVQLHEWKFLDIAKECEDFLGPKGYAAVQTSPVSENLIITGRPWYERYQPISYEVKSRSGNARDFLQMTRRCLRAGIQVYVDVLPNHMTANATAPAVGTGGSVAAPNKLLYPAVPYNRSHFNQPICQIKDFSDPKEARVCELVGLHDLNQSIPHVQRSIANFLNYLTAIGAAGFRVDAAKHMYPKDLKNIYSRLNPLSQVLGFPAGTYPFIYQEVGDSWKFNYTQLGSVTEFAHATNMAAFFKHHLNASSLRNYGGPHMGMLPNRSALVFVDNHDLQRQNPNTLTYKNPQEIRAAYAFTLAHPYGIPRVMSSFDFKTVQDGPPHDKAYNIESPRLDSSGQCRSGWVCEHRWPTIVNMIAFRNAVGNSPLKNFWSDDRKGVASFCRGNKGFLMLSSGASNFEERVATCLPPGLYCDAMKQRRLTDKCEHSSRIVVRYDGTALIKLSKTSDELAVALHVGNRIKANGDSED